MRTAESESAGTVPAPILAGRYVVIRMLGKGAQARVYLAMDTRLKQWRAIKVLAPNLLDDEHVRSRFDAEAQVMARLSHPNLMRVVDVDHDGRVPFLVMELARGGSVLEWVKRNGPMPPHLVLDVAMQCAEGLQASHDQGIVHRDVKPHNILIREDNRVVLTDFGIAQIEDGDHLTATGAAMGTFVFMAPEQRSDAKSVDHRADVYGLGATMFTLLTTRTSAELFFAEARDELLDGIPDEVQPMILAACKYERNQRYPTMKAFRDAMQVRQSRLPPSKPGPALYAEVVRVPSELPRTLGPEANLGDLVAVIEPRATTGVITGTGKTDPPNERSFEEMPTVMPYRMPARTGTTGSSELPQYVDTSTLHNTRPRPATAPPPPPELAPPPIQVISPVREVVVDDTRINRLAFAAIGVSVFLVLVLLGVGLAEKMLASRAREAAGKDLVTTVTTFTSLPDELKRSGADGDALSQLFFGVEDAQGQNRVAAAVAFAEKALEEGEKVEESTLAESQLRQLRTDLEIYREADTVWQGAKASRLGRLTGEVGLH